MLTRIQFSLLQKSVSLRMQHACSVIDFGQVNMGKVDTDYLIILLIVMRKFL